MRRLPTLAAVLALSVLFALPASALPAISAIDLDEQGEGTGEADLTDDEGPEAIRLQPCTQSGDTLTLDGASGTVDGPVGPLTGTTSLTFRLDLSGQEQPDDVDHNDRARVNGTIEWLVPHDYDLDLNGEQSQALQPVDPSIESASTILRHCQTVTLTVINFAATGLDPIDYDLGVSLL